MGARLLVNRYSLSPLLARRDAHEGATVSTGAVQQSCCAIASCVVHCA
jgi:hypothetical protein